MARGVPGWLVVQRRSSLSHSCHQKLCICGKLFQFLHCRRFCIVLVGFVLEGIERLNCRRRLARLIGALDLNRLG
jgi:hypothetical protein